MLRRLFQLFLVLLPLGLFAGVLLEVRELLNQGQTLRCIVTFLVALAVLALLEGLLFRCWILPSWSRALSERFYAGAYTPDQDALASLISRLSGEHDRRLLPELENLVRRDPRRVRGWLEWARLLADEFGEPARAADVLLEGAKRVPRREDRAMLLCRAAHLFRNRLNEGKKAEELYADVAQRYPHTSYGKLAQSRLNR